MKKLLIVAAGLFLFASAAPEASANGPGPFGFGFQPYGFYQPYGAQYGSSLRTPPYFATNPPVYYGGRYARPYGVSPFAAPPMVSVSSSYRARLYSDAQRAPKVISQNPCISHSCVVPPKPLVKLGAVQSNPFANPVEHIAKK
ncbi:MAG: hypothetical protein AAGA03_03780 [Planctomycetota bacterium]